jgi:hypothetical protein
MGKKDVLVNTPTLTWVYTKTFKERRRRDPYLDLYRQFLQTNRMLFTPKQIIKIGYKNIDTNNKHRRVENEKVGNTDCQ